MQDKFEYLPEMLSSDAGSGLDNCLNKKEIVASERNPFSKPAMRVRTLPQKPAPVRPNIQVTATLRDPGLCHCPLYELLMVL